MVYLVLLSILIYTYNRREYLMQAVDSVLSNNMDPLKYEIVVVKGFVEMEIDDYLSRNNIRSLLVDNKSLGVKIAKGVRECRGDFICFLDDDDEFEPNKLAVIKNILDHNNRVDFIHNSLTIINEDGNVIDLNPKENISENLAYMPGSDQYSVLSSVMRHRGDWYLSAMCIRRSIMENAIDTLESINQSVDKFIFHLALNFGKEIMMIVDKITKYRFHRSTTTYMGTMEEFINRRGIFFENSVKVFYKIVEISKGRPGWNVARCQLLQHRINLYFISKNQDHKVTIRELLEYMSCLKYNCTRYQVMWIFSYLIRKMSFRISKTLYYKFFELSFKNVQNA
jgi:glycosyltransferase involved in cell wall biosynthesis